MSLLFFVSRVIAIILARIYLPTYLDPLSVDLVSGFFGLVLLIDLAFAVLPYVAAGYLVALIWRYWVKQGLPKSLDLVSNKIKEKSFDPKAKYEAAKRRLPVQIHEGLEVFNRYMVDPFLLWMMDQVDARVSLLKKDQ